MSEKIKWKWVDKQTLQSPYGEWYTFIFEEERERLVALLNQLSEENEQLQKEKMEANAFIVEKGLELEFIKWCM